MGKPTLTAKQINKIVYLRERGHSLPDIRHITGHGSSTIFKYIQNVRILPEFKEFWLNKKKPSVLRMLKSQQKALKEADLFIRDINKKEKIIITTCLYWAEGEKRDFSISNTDPHLIKVFVECLKEFGVKKENLKISVRVYEDLNIRNAINFWSKLIGVSKKQIISVNILKGKKNGKLQYGMCRVRVSKGEYLLKLIKSLTYIIENKLSPRSSMDRIGDS